ncbi:hypothetical protein KL933_002587 [Ogataea haglerorum]|uniref:Uncharacterized protein n=1 Tax=Ogataea haglerorum TaxID=1937702 RepID=A0AAN6I0J7_9ASCO|nr:hypothetical protein KL933_002587 [Ogataea haglerorum]
MLVETLNGLKASGRPVLVHMWRKYVLVPFGTLLMMLLLYGINEIIKRTTINFPASVCLMLLMYGGLSLNSWLFGEHRTDVFLKYIEIPCGFALRWMNLYFTPPFVTLVLSDKVNVAEAFTIMAVFVVGYIFTFGFMAYFTWGLQLLLGTYKDHVEADEKDEECRISESNHNNSEQSSSTDKEEVAWEVKVRDFVLEWIDFFVYGLVFVAGLPVYFATGYEMPVQLAAAVLLFRACLLIPAKLRRVLHPILISFSLCLLVYYILSLIKGQNYFTCIRHYKTGRTYLTLFDSEAYREWPGAGDFLISLMDISIVSLSLSMYKYRGDLKRHFASVLPPIVVCAFMSFFIYPPLCYHLGISSARALGFTGRSVTMALGIPLVTALGGSTQLMAVTTIISGILGVLVGDLILFKVFRVRKHDFVSRGVSFGLNCGAVSTYYLTVVDPRAGAMSALSFTFYGTLMIVLSAIHPLVRIVQKLVGW